jgi:tight adherence protein C
VNVLGVLLAFMTAGSIALVAVGLALFLEERRVQERLFQYASRGVSLSDLEMERSLWQRVFAPAFARLTRKIASLAPQAMLARTRRHLELAGHPLGLRALDFVGLRVFLGLGTGVASLLFLGAVGIEFGRAFVLAFLLGALGFMLPVLWLGSKVKQRKQEILRALPDALDLLTISVEAGLGFDAALAKVTEKWDNALTREFARVLAEIRVGKLRREALRDMAERVEVPELKSFVAAIVQADQLGVSIGRVLHVQAAQMRLRRRQRAEEIARQAPVKMLLPLVFLIFPALFLVLLGPAFISIKNSGVLGMMGG